MHRRHQQHPWKKVFILSQVCRLHFATHFLKLEAPSRGVQEIDANFI